MRRRWDEHQAMVPQGILRGPTWQIARIELEKMTDFKTWQCRGCGYVYNEAEGDPDEMLSPGTRWADIPDDWVCPLCGTAKSDFDMVEFSAT